MTLPPWRRAAVGSFAIMALAQIGVPLVSDDRALTVVVIVGFALTTLHLIADRWGIRRAWTSLGVVTVSTLLLEWVGSTTGFPFGEYEYTDLLVPQIAHVPVIVPLAWFAMGVPALVVGRRLVPNRWGAIAMGAVALTAWDLFLDPQMVGEGYWEWAVDGWYRGIPFSNYLGWLGSSFVLLAIVDRILPGTNTVLDATSPATDRPSHTKNQMPPVLDATSPATDRPSHTKNQMPPVLDATSPASDRPSHTEKEDSGGSIDWLVALYTWWAVMNTVGFVVFFGDPLVGVVGGGVMIPIALAALRPDVDAISTSARDLVSR